VQNSFTLAELEDWEGHGATWRALELDGKHAVIQLCSCFGEPMDQVESSDPQLIQYVRTHPDV
jgi:hypothetical protein